MNMEVHAGAGDPGPVLVFSTHEGGAQFRMVKHPEDRWGLEIDAPRVKYRLMAHSFNEAWSVMMRHLEVWKRRSLDTPKKQDWSPRDRDEERP